MGCLGGYPCACAGGACVRVKVCSRSGRGGRKQRRLPPAIKCQEPSAALVPFTAARQGRAQFTSNHVCMCVRAHLEASSCARCSCSRTACRSACRAPAAACVACRSASSARCRSSATSAWCREAAFDARPRASSSCWERSLLCASAAASCCAMAPLSPAWWSARSRARLSAALRAATCVVCQGARLVRARWGAGAWGRERGAGRGEGSDVCAGGGGD